MPGLSSTIKNNFIRPLGDAKTFGFPRRLIAPFFILLAAFNIIPIGLLSYYNLDPFKIVSLFFLFYAFITFKEWRNKNVLFQALFIIAILCSYVNMVIMRGKVFDWTSYYCLYYLYFFVIMSSVRETDDIYLYIRFLLIVCFLATLVHIFFYINPWILEGTLTDIRMGSLRTDVDETRIFIPGSGFIAIGFLYLVTKILYRKRINVVDIFLLAFFSFSIFFISSIRTYLLGVVVVVFVLFLVKKISFKAILALLVPAIVLIGILYLFNDSAYNYIVSRFDIFFKLGDFKPVDAFNLNIDYGGELDLGTVYWRIMESAYVLQVFFKDLPSFLFGQIGVLYDFLGVEENAAPHISLVGVYFLFGLVGLITFLTFLVNFTVLIIKNLRLSKKTDLEFLAIVFTVIWFTLFIFSFFGGIYYSELILMITFTSACSVFLNKKLKLITKRA